MKQENVSFEELIASSLRILEASCNKELSIYISSVDDVRCNNLILIDIFEHQQSLMSQFYRKATQSLVNLNIMFEWMRSATGETYGKMTYIIIYLSEKSKSNTHSRRLYT